LNPITKLVIQVVCLLFLAVGLGLIAYSRRSDPQDVGTPAVPAPADVSAQSPLSKRIPESGFLGVVMAKQSVDLAPKLSGRLEAVNVRMGQRVNANAVIAVLDTAAIIHDLHIGEAKLNAAKADEAKAKVDLAQAKDELDALAPLKSKGLISARELATGQYKHDAADSAYEAARARVREAEAQLQQLKETLAAAHVRAPFAGVISERYVDPGAMVSPSVPIVRLVGADELWVRFAVPEEVGGSVALGAAVRVEVSTHNQVLMGVVENVAPEVDVASRLIYAEAKLDPSAVAGPKKMIPSGTAVRVSIVAPIHTGAH
jgi:RND family efflux transporter MFP subunit